MKKMLLICMFFSSFAVSAKGPGEGVRTDQGILLVNQKEYKQAKEVLKAEYEKGDAEATFWLAIAMYKSGQHFEAGDVFLKAAKLGDPWAMSVLGGRKGLYSGSPCHYLGWPCDSAWYDKALEGWEALAMQGDPDAIYALAVVKINWWTFIPYYRYIRTLELAKQAISNGGGYRLLGYSLLARESDVDELLEIAANQGYAPAMRSLYYKLRETNPKEAEKWINEAVKLGYPPAAHSLSVAYLFMGEPVVGGPINKELLKKSYFYEFIFKTWTRGSISKLRYEAISKSELVPIKQQAKEFMKDIKVNQFLDKNANAIFNLH